MGDHQRIPAVVCFFGVFLVEGLQWRRDFLGEPPGALTDAPFLSEGHASNLGQYSQVVHQRPEMGTQKVPVEAYIMKLEVEEEYRF